MTRYICEFCWHIDGKNMPLMVPENGIVESWAEVLKMIGEHSDAERTGINHGKPLETVRITELNSDTGRFSDMTEDALIDFGLSRMEQGADWPWWLADMTPASVLDAA